jgi:hypothetical protein
MLAVKSTRRSSGSAAAFSANECSVVRGGVNPKNGYPVPPWSAGDGIKNRDHTSVFV